MFTWRLVLQRDCVKFQKMSKTIMDFVGIVPPNNGGEKPLVVPTPKVGPLVLEDLIDSVEKELSFPVLLFLAALPNCIPGVSLLCSFKSRHSQQLFQTASQVYWCSAPSIRSVLSTSSARRNHLISPVNMIESPNALVLQYWLFMSTALIKLFSPVRYCLQDWSHSFSPKLIMFIRLIKVLCPGWLSRPDWSNSVLTAHYVGWTDWIIFSRQMMLTGLIKQSSPVSLVVL